MVDTNNVATWRVSSAACASTCNSALVVGVKGGGRCELCKVLVIGWLNCWLGTFGRGLLRGWRCGGGARDSLGDALGSVSASVLSSMPSGLCCMHGVCVDGVSSKACQLCARHRCFEVCVCVLYHSLSIVLWRGRWRKGRIHIAIRRFSKYFWTRIAGAVTAWRGRW